jgi:glycosyltransferase 2 family protein
VKPAEDKLRRPLFRKTLQWVFVMAVFVFLGRVVWENWNQVRGAAFSFRAVPLLLSTLIFVVSYFIQTWAWYLITLRLEVALPLRETVATWFYSQLGKYLPGKVWLLLGRFYLYDSKGKSKKAITVALYLEAVTLIMAASLVFLLSLLFLKEAKPFTLGIPLPGVILLFLLCLFSLHPRVLQKLFNTVLVRLKREPFHIPISYLQILWILTVCVLSWIVGGIGFYLFVDSVFIASPKQILFLTGALAISSTIGLLALFAPSGLGVREGVLVYLLSSIMPTSVAVILSVLTRLWMTLIEIGLIGVVYLLNKFRKKE